MNFQGDPKRDYIGIDKDECLGGSDRLPNQVSDMAGKRMIVSTWRCGTCDHEQDIRLPEGNFGDLFPNCGSCGGTGPWRFLSAR